MLFCSIMYFHVPLLEKHCTKSFVVTTTSCGPECNSSSEFPRQYEFIRWLLDHPKSAQIVYLLSKWKYQIKNISHEIWENLCRPDSMWDTLPSARVLPRKSQTSSSFLGASPTTVRGPPKGYSRTHACLLTLIWNESCCLSTEFWGKGASTCYSEEFTY